MCSQPAASSGKGSEDHGGVTPDSGEVWGEKPGVLEKLAFDMGLERQNVEKWT